MSSAAINMYPKRALKLTKKKKALLNLKAMTRKKVTLAYITNDSERKASYKKRKKGLIKKVSELSTLCGVEACLIIYSPYDPVPEVWPTPLDAQSILARFRKLSSMDQSRKMVNQESFTRQRIKKATEQLRRLQKDNTCRELEAFMFRCILGQASLDDLQFHDLSEMGWVITQTLREIKARMEAMAAEHQRNLTALPPLPPLLPPPPPMLALPPPPAVEEAPPRMEEDGMESFPWNLVQSPGGGGETDGTGLGWDPGMVLPYPYFFGPSSSSQSGRIPNPNPNPSHNPNPNPNPFNP